jgi:putative oxidoreductase
MKNLGLLILRLTVGSLLAGHGLQKLFGWFGGPGPKGTRGMMEQLGMKPGHIWGSAVMLGETSGGLLTALGLFSPLGPQNIMSAMAVAVKRVHWSKGVWNQGGGFEFPLTNLAAASALALTGPGRYSLDHIFGIRLPRWLIALSWMSALVITAAALIRPEIAHRVTAPLQSAPVAYEPELPYEQPADVALQSERRPRQAAHPEQQKVHSRA